MKLIKFCTEEKDITLENTTENNCYKYPFLASEIFGSNPTHLASFLFGKYEPPEKDEKENENKDDE